MRSGRGNSNRRLMSIRKGVENSEENNDWRKGFGTTRIIDKLEEDLGVKDCEFCIRRKGERVRIVLCI